MSQLKPCTRNKLSHLPGGPRSTNVAGG